LADRNKAAALDALLRDLSQATIGATFNEFREVGSDDLPDGPAIRLANLRHYLEERAAADVVAIGEAAGYQGMRWSGIAFTSEYDLRRWGDPFRRSSRRPRPWKEPSGTIVHGILEELGAERRVILWNTVLTHPHLPFWPPERRITEARYQTIEFPFAEFAAPHFVIEQQLTLDEAAGIEPSADASRNGRRRRVRRTTDRHRTATPTDRRWPRRCRGTW